MDAVQLIFDAGRMCDFYDNCGKCDADGCCSVYHWSDLEKRERFIKVVEKWSSEHPQKTMLQDFLEKFPNAKLEEGSPPDCPYMYGYTSKNDDDNFCPGHTCLECWNRPVEG